MQLASRPATTTMVAMEVAVDAVVAIAVIRTEAVIIDVMIGATARRST